MYPWASCRVRTPPAAPIPGCRLFQGHPGDAARFQVSHVQVLPVGAHHQMHRIGSIGRRTVHFFQGTVLGHRKGRHRAEIPMDRIQPVLGLIEAQIGGILPAGNHLDFFPSSPLQPIHRDAPADGFSFFRGSGTNIGKHSIPPGSMQETEPTHQGEHEDDGHTQGRDPEQFGEQAESLSFPLPLFSWEQLAMTRDPPVDMGLMPATVAEHTMAATIWSRELRPRWPPPGAPWESGWGIPPVGAGKPAHDAAGETHEAGAVIGLMKEARPRASRSMPPSSFTAFINTLMPQIKIRVFQAGSSRPSFHPPCR